MAGSSDTAVYVIRGKGAGKLELCTLYKGDCFCYFVQDC